METIFSERFLKNSEKLPQSIRRKLAELLELLRINHFHPSLHTKRLTGQLSDQYSFRITRNWRVIFIFESQGVIKVMDVGNRKDIYR